MMDFPEMNAADLPIGGRSAIGCCSGRTSIGGLLVSRLTIGHLLGILLLGILLGWLTVLRLLVRWWTVRVPRLLIRRSRSTGTRGSPRHGEGGNYRV
jgi:hypothetical protein